MEEKHSSIHPLITVLKESGVIIAFFTGLLFIWGYLLIAFVHTASHLPGEAFPDKTVPEYLVLGAFTAATVFLPVVLAIYLVLWFIDKFTGGRIANFVSVNRGGPFNPVVAVVLLFLLSLLSLIPIAKRLASGKRKARVKSVTSNSSSKVVATKYEGLIFIAKKGTVYIFVDKLEEDATIYLLNEAEVGEIIFSRAQ